MLVKSISSLVTPAAKIAFSIPFVFPALSEGLVRLVQVLCQDTAFLSLQYASPVCNALLPT